MKRLSPDAGRGASITIVVDGEPVRAHPGESVATALLADARRVLRFTAKRGAPRGLFCGMGVCFDCLVTIDGAFGMRGCMTRVRDGMRIETEGADGTRTR
jgi:predicted molibdopterin-dependent oxidoreductase YjgC